MLERVAELAMSAFGKRGDEGTDADDADQFTEDSDDEWPSDLGELIKRSTMDARRYMWGWALCQRFLAGDQYISYSAQAGGFISVMSTPGRSNVACNIIKPIYRAKISQFSLQYPDVAVEPESPALKDIRKATSSEEVLHACWHQKKVKRVLMEAIELATQIGTGAIHTYFDPEVGDFVHEAKGAFDIRFEPGAVNDQQSSWVAIRSIVKRALAEECYPGHEEDFVMASKSNETDRYKNIGTIDPIPDDCVEIFDVYFQDGRHAVVSGNAYLWKGRTPLNVVPVQLIRYMKYADRIYGEGLIWSLIDIQQAYNRVLCRTLDMVEAQSNPLWWVPVGSGVVAQALSNVIGGFISYNPAGGEPKREPGIPVPAHMFEMLKSLQLMAQDVAEIHSASLGKAASLRSGKSMETLIEQDQSQTRITMDSIENAVVDLARVQLAFVAECWTEKRMVRIFDAYGKAVWRSMSSEDIATDPAVHIAANSLFQSDIQDRERRLFELAEKQAIPWDEAIKRSTLRNFKQDRMKALQDNYHASEVLEWAKQHMPLQFTPDDPIETIRDQFGEYIRSPDYWQNYMRATASGDPALVAAEIENMNYIHDIYVALQLPIGATPEQVQMAEDAKVYPRPKPTGAPMLTGNVPQPGNPTPQQGPMHPDDVALRMQAQQANGQSVGMNNPTGISGLQG